MPSFDSLIKRVQSNDLTLTSITLSTVTMNINAIKATLKCLKNNTSVTSLTLTYGMRNDDSKEEMLKLAAELFAQNTTITHVVLMMSPAYMGDILTVTETNTQLIALEVITSSELNYFTEIAKALKNNTSLLSLRLKITPSMLEIITAELKSNKTLRSFSYHNYNASFSDATSIITDLLNANDTLSSFELIGHQFEDSQKSRGLVTVLKNHPNLTLLKLTDIEFNEGYYQRVIVELLITNKKITTLILGNIDMNVQCLQALEMNTTLKSVSLIDTNKRISSYYKRRNNFFNCPVITDNNEENRIIEDKRWYRTQAPLVLAALLQGHYQNVISLRNTDMLFEIFKFLIPEDESIANKKQFFYKMKNYLSPQNRSSLKKNAIPLSFRSVKQKIVDLINALVQPNSQNDFNLGIERWIVDCENKEQLQKKLLRLYDDTKNDLNIAIIDYYFWLLLIGPLLLLLSLFLEENIAVSTTKKDTLSTQLNFFNKLLTAFNEMNPSKEEDPTSELLPRIK